MKREELNKLLEKYYDGETSREEEEILMNFFSGDSVLTEYQAEKEIFSHYAGSERIPVPSVDFEDRILKGIDDLEKKQRSISLKKRYIKVMSAAAAILLLIGSYFVFFNKEVQEDTFSDPQLAYAETMRILNEVSVKLNKGTEALKPLSKMQNDLETGLESIDRSATIISTSLNRSKLFEEVSAENKK